MPFLPVFGGGISKFQPVYVGDLAQFVEVLSRDEKQTQESFEGKVVEAGGPQSKFLLPSQRGVYTDRCSPFYSVYLS